MERDVDLAVHHAADMARVRGGRLAAITLRGSGVTASVISFANATLARLGVSCSEIRFELDAGPVRLALVELHPERS